MTNLIVICLRSCFLVIVPPTILAILTATEVLLIFSVSVIFFIYFNFMVGSS